MSRRPTLALVALLIAGVGSWLALRPLQDAASALRALISGDEASSPGSRDRPEGVALAASRPVAHGHLSPAEGRGAGQPAVSCDVRAIDARTNRAAVSGPSTSRRARIDRRLRDLQARFSRPPFSHLRRFRLVSKRRLSLRHDQRGSVRLPGARTLRLTYRGATTINGRRQLRLSLTLHSFAARATYQSLRGLRLLLDPNTPLVIADSGRGRLLRLIALRCHERPRPTSQRARPSSAPAS
jgi:hypothetical protein